MIHSSSQKPRGEVHFLTYREMFQKKFRMWGKKKGVGAEINLNQYPQPFSHPEPIVLNNQIKVMTPLKHFLEMHLCICADIDHIN